MKKSVLVPILLFSAIITFGIQMVSGTILLSQPESLYNVGDQLSANLTLIPRDSVNDFLIARIICLDRELEIYKNPYYIKAGERENVLISVKLDKNLLGNLDGECFLRVFYANESAESQEFELTNIIDVSVSLDNSVADPGSNVKVSGIAKKRNGQMFNGYFEISISEIGVIVNGEVFSGVFNSSVAIQRNSKSGNYNLNVRVFEKELNGEVSNEGNTVSPIKINQIIERADIALSSVNVAPENTITYNLLLYDQANDEAQQDITSIIYKPDGSILEKKIVRAGETNGLRIESDYPSGYWNIEAKFGDIVSKKSFYVEELKRISLDVDNNTLVIKNTGNVNYKGAIEVLIGNHNEIVDLDLDVGATKKFKLIAPDGSYTISVKDGSNISDLGSSYLTGDVIGIRDLDSLGISSNGKFFLWILIILILICVGIYCYKKILKRTYIGKTPSLKSKFNQSDNMNSNADLPKVDYTLIRNSSGGKREEACVLALKIKNIADLEKSGGSSFGSIERAISKVKENGAKIYDQGEYKICIFTKSTTGIQDNNLIAIRTALNIEDILREYNKKNAERIKFGIGLNFGEMIVENIGGKLKFTSVGSTVISAKKSAGYSSAEVLMTSLLHRKVVGKVKSDRVTDGLYRVLRLTTGEQHSEFINKFMKRQKK